MDKVINNRTDREPSYTVEAFKAKKIPVLPFRGTRMSAADVRNLHDMDRLWNETVHELVLSNGIMDLFSGKPLDLLIDAVRTRFDRAHWLESSICGDCARSRELQEEMRFLRAIHDVLLAMRAQQEAGRLPV